MKSEMGHTRLKDEMEVVREACIALESAGMEFTLIGGSAMGTAIPITSEWMSERMVSRLIDIDMDIKFRDSVEPLLLDSGWHAEDPSRYFGIQWKQNGITGSMCTIRDESLFRNPEGYYLSVTYFPTKVYRLDRRGGIMETAIDHGLTYSETLTYKVIRGNSNDIMDMAHSAVASDLSGFGHNVHSAAILEKHVRHHGLTRVERNLNEIYGRIAELVVKLGRDAHSNADQSSDWLSRLLRR